MHSGSIKDALILTLTLYTTNNFTTEIKQNPTGYSNPIMLSLNAHSLHNPKLSTL
jgi:hypothetical protein